MKNHSQAEEQVLSRLMYLLEEGSVGHLAEQDHAFGQFVEHMYGLLHEKSRSLQQRV